MREHERTTWTAAIAWSLVAVVLFVLGMFFAEEIFAYFSFVAVGLAAGSGVKAYRSQLHQSRPNTLLEEQVADLKARLEEAESEIKRLRVEADFDRKLMSSHNDTSSVS
jgi:hypothetical protein